MGWPTLQIGVHTDGRAACSLAGKKLKRVTPLDALPRLAPALGTAPLGIAPAIAQAASHGANCQDGMAGSVRQLQLDAAGVSDHVRN